MRHFRKGLIWLARIAGILLALVILTGLAVRVFTPTPTPPGELVDVGGFRLHIHPVGEPNHRPTLVIESGAGAPSEYYYWLGEGLKDSMRVVRYDRAGIGYSDPGETPRDPETIARELHTLLEKAGESPPYILAGHSYGGHYIRIFTDLYPDEVAGLVFLDSPHPDESRRLGMPDSPAILDAMYYAGAVIGDLGILHVFDRLFGPILWAPGLPEAVTDRFHDYTINGQYLWGYLEEEKGYPALTEMAAKITDLDSIPIRVFSGTHLNEKALLRMGLDPEFIRQERATMQEEIAALSANGQVIFLDGGHITIFTQQEQAELICQEISRLVREMEDE